MRPVLLLFLLEHGKSSYADRLVREACWAGQSNDRLGPATVITMKNPWTRKNPFMSMWLSAANSGVGSARGHAAAAVKREFNKAASAATTAGVNQVMDFRTDALKPPSAPRKRPKAR